MVMLWAGYTLMLWGYCLVKGYAIGIADLTIPGRYTGTWPPPLTVDGKSQPPPQAPPGSHPGDMPWTYPHGGPIA